MISCALKDFTLQRCTVHMFNKHIGILNILHEMVYVSKYLYRDMNEQTVCKTTDFIIRDQKD